MTNYQSSNKNILYETKFLQLKQTEYSNGKKWVYAHRPNTNNVVVIVPVICNKHGNSTIFLTTKRPPLIAEQIAEFSLEFPAGLVGDENIDETVEIAIKKELLEETGYKADKIKICAPLVSSSAGCTSETYVIAVVEINEDKLYAQPVDDGGVINKIHKIPVSEISSFIAAKQNEGFAISSPVYAGLYFLNEYIKSM